MGNKILATLCICFSLLMMVVLTGCDFSFLDSDSEIADKKIDKIITLISEKDKEGIKELFAKNKIKDISNFDESIDDLIAYFDGEYESKISGGLGVDNDVEGNDTAKYFNLSYDITTSGGKYRLAVYWCQKDTTDSLNNGIWSLYIISAEKDPNIDFSYGGDGLWTPGINIDKISAEDLKVNN